MARIHQLPPSVVNKIAAGEVIERPASVVKELLENAVDAGATRIDVRLEKGGSEVIRIADNGCGIAADELPLAVASHATSKITCADDLFSIATLGFRGEALASIAEVSRLLIRSRTSGGTSGGELEVVGGVASPVTPIGCPIGTTIEVRNLFFNTPVRHKFLRSVQKEMGHSIEAMTRLALAHPHIHFTLAHNGRTIHDLPPVSDIRGRIAAFFGDELANDLIEITSASDGVALDGFVANPMHSRATARMQYLFLNGRAIRDRALQHALGEAYRGLLLTGRQPICFLRLEMPADLVDVNVHPTKQEVRFQDSGRLYSLLLGTLRTKFLTTDLQARGATSLPAADLRFDSSASSSGASELVHWAKEQLGRQTAAQSSASTDGIANSSPQMSWPTTDREPLRLHRIDAPASLPFDIGRPPAEPGAVGGNGFAADLGEVRGEGRSIAPPHFDVPSNALQVHDRYLVVETEAGIEVIDQHA